MLRTLFWDIQLGNVFELPQILNTVQSKVVLAFPNLLTKRAEKTGFAIHSWAVILHRLSVVKLPQH